MKVLVFESSAIYRSIIKEIFNSNPNLTLCDFAGSDADFIEKLRIHHPDCISIDATVLTEKEIYRTFNQVQKLKLPSIFFISDSQLLFSYGVQTPRSRLPRHSPSSARRTS